MKYFETVIEALSWLLILLSPLLLGVGLGVVLLIYTGSSLGLYAFGSIGFIAGAYLAERVRKNGGCTNFLAKLMR